MSEERPYIGGQAVLEGVMMRSPTSFAVVVRRRDGSLSVRERPMTDYRTGWKKLPLVRGVYSLVESLKLGHEALKFSADFLEKDWYGTATNMLSAFGMSLFAMTTKDAEDKDATVDPEQKKGVPGAMLFMMVLFIVALPQIAAAIAKRVLHIEANVTSPQFQALTGFFKLCIVLGYLLLIRRVEQIRRVFQYHGAEHKTISTYEANEELSVENARKKTTLHPRCGTTFLVMVVIVSILLFTILGAIIPWRVETGSAVLDNVIFFLIKLPFLPVLAAITFEIQRLFARYCTTGPLRALLWPGFLVQKITTIEPDDSQLEVALASLAVTLKRERGQIKGKGGDSNVDNLQAIAA
jgi:uncharacterized protein YqhQ